MYHAEQPLVSGYRSLALSGKRNPPLGFYLHGLLPCPKYHPTIRAIQEQTVFLCQLCRTQGLCNRSQDSNALTSPCCRKHRGGEIQGAALIVFHMDELNSCSAQPIMVVFCFLFFFALCGSVGSDDIVFAISRRLHHVWHFGTRYCFYLLEVYWPECLPSGELIGVAVSLRCSAGTDVTDAAHPVPVTFSLIFPSSSQKLPPPRKGENTNEYEN